MKEADWEIASHGLKWIDYRDFSSDEERAHLSEAIRIHTEVTGERPLGWYTGRTSEHTNRLVAEEGGFLYTADSYADELPYWEAHGERQQLDRALYARRQRHALRHAAGLQLGRSVLRLSEGQFRHALCGRRDRAEDAVGRSPLPSRRPSRPRRGARPFPRLRRFSRERLGRPAHRHRPALDPPPSSRRRETQHHEPGAVRRAFRRRLRAFALDRRANATMPASPPAQDTAEGLHAAMVRVLSEATHEQKLALINAHPDLAGRLKLADLTADSRGEQSSAGLDSPDRGGARPIPDAQRCLQGRNSASRSSWP